jgi:hypothetical protein
MSLKSIPPSLSSLLSQAASRKHYTKDGITGDYFGERMLRKTHTKKAIHAMSTAQFQAAKKAVHNTSDKSHQSHAGRHTRTNFDADLMNSVRARDKAWQAAQELLGHSHAIFNPPLKGKNKSRTVTAAHGSLKTIKGLHKTLNLTAWRLEEDIADLHHLTDEQRTAVLAVLKTLIESIQAWAKQKGRSK